MAGRTRSKNALSSLFIFGFKRHRTRLTRAVFEENFDAALGLLQFRMPKTRELDAPFEQLQSRIYRQFSVFQLLHDFFESL